MSIWFTQTTTRELNRLYRKTAANSLGIQITEIGDDYLKGTMPVDIRTHQPMGFLHGGASVLLAETLAGVGAQFCVDQVKYYCVGLEINANHVRGAKDGYVEGIASPIHIGRTTQVWDIRINHSKIGLICVSRHTVAVLNVRER